MAKKKKKAKRKKKIPKADLQAWHNPWKRWVKGSQLDPLRMKTGGITTVDSLAAKILTASVMDLDVPLTIREASLFCGAREPREGIAVLKLAMYRKEFPSYESAVPGDPEGSMVIWLSDLLGWMDKYPVATVAGLHDNPMTTADEEYPSYWMKELFPSEWQLCLDVARERRARRIEDMIERRRGYRGKGRSIFQEQTGGEGPPTAGPLAVHRRTQKWKNEVLRRVIAEFGLDRYSERVREVLRDRLGHLGDEQDGEGGAPCPPTQNPDSAHR